MVTDLYAHLLNIVGCASVFTDAAPSAGNDGRSVPLRSEIRIGSVVAANESVDDFTVLRTW